MLKAERDTAGHSQGPGQPLAAADGSSLPHLIMVQLLLGRKALRPQP